MSRHCFEFQNYKKEIKRSNLIFTFLVFFILDDQVFMDWEDGRKEYVLNETGRVYVGGAKKPQGRPWNFGQVTYNVVV